jgi:hypothetical protein
VATASRTAILKTNRLAVWPDAGLSVGAPVDAAAGLAQMEVAPGVDEHLLAAEKAAVVLASGLGCVVVRQHLRDSSLLAVSNQLSAISLLKADRR